MVDLQLFARHRLDLSRFRIASVRDVMRKEGAVADSWALRIRLLSEG
jgi:hypothetical protein